MVDLPRNLNELRKSNLLCDTIVRAEGTDFPAHRCVLSAGSQYFRALFTTELSENQSHVVELKMVKCAALAEVLEFLYTGEAKADNSNAQDLIVAADYLIIPTLKSKASEFLEGTVSASNCLALESFASQFHCESLKKAAVVFILKHFVAVVKSEDFKTLDFNMVKNLISQDEIIVTKEEDVYDAVVSWVKYDTSTRECLFPELLKCVRVFSMSKYRLREILGKDDLVVKNPECMRTVLQGLDTFLFPDDYQVLLQRPRLCLKSKELVVVFTGGHELGEETVLLKPRSSTFGYLVATKQWISLPKMPFRRTQHAAAVSCGQLYVAGGQTIAPLCYFNPLQNKWIPTKEDYIAPCTGASLTTHNEELYMIGGKDCNWFCVRKYNCRLGKWTDLSSMKFPRAAHCAVVLEGLIYVIAGQNLSACLKSVECFDPSKEQWTQIPDINNQRRFAAAASSGEKIILVGGFSDMDFDSIEASCEIFDKSSNQWNLVSTPIEPRAACGIVSVGDHVYLFGGEDGVEDLDSVECYDIQEDAWSFVGIMPKKRTGLQASLLQLPTEILQNNC